MDVRKFCGDECPLECDSITYNLYTSAADYPSRIYADSLMKNAVIKSKFASNPSDLTFDSLKRHMAHISVFYNDLGYELYSELEKTDLVDLIASIGGTLGLFLGMSFLSFVEILDVFLQIFFTLGKRKNSSVNTVSP
jgi:amiloride-sensitive sodium channel subunit alpha/amiloride-sensitive sodium channel subunit gamma